MVGAAVLVVPVPVVMAVVVEARDVVVVMRGVVVTVRFTQGCGMHWNCAGLGRPGTFIAVITHWPSPVGLMLVRPSVTAHAGFGSHAVLQSTLPHVMVVTESPRAPHTSAIANRLAPSKRPKQ